MDADEDLRRRRDDPRRRLLEDAAELRSDRGFWCLALLLYLLAGLLLILLSG